MNSLVKGTDTFESTLSLFSIELLGQLFDQAPDSLMVTDKNGKLLMINRKAQKFLGYNNDDILGANIQSIIPSWSKTKYEESMNQVNAKAISKSKEEIEVELTLNTVILHNQIFTTVAIRNTSFYYARQVTLEKYNKQLAEQNFQLENLSNTDPLSGLLNRRGLEKVLHREISYSQRNNSVLLAALIDLDDFKRINDNYGHAAGDQVLRQITQIFKQELRSIDWIGRVGGDEFLVFLPCTNLFSGARVAERVRLALHQTSITTENDCLHLTASMGIVSLPFDVNSIQQVLELTKATLKASKRGGKNRVTVDDGDSGRFQSPCSTEIKTLLNGFGTSISQPIINLNDGSTMGYELFSRGPQGTLEMPEEFFRVSLENDILTLIDLRCFRLSIELSNLVPEGKGVHINIFPSTLVDVPIDKLIELAENGTEKSKLCFEISSKRLMTDSSQLFNHVSKLKSKGFKLALDDIGYGSSALEAVILLEPEFIKIDGICIRGIYKDKLRQKFVSKLLNIAKAVNAQTIAEQIESKEELACLKDLGVNFGQGWFWGKPS